MDLIQSAILGLVEGITEFLPISSTGHLILTSHIMGLSGAKVDAFEVIIQLGAILAVVFLYRHRFACLFDFKTKTGFTGLRGLTLLALTSLPILVLGKLLEHTIKAHLFNPTVVTIALAVGGVVLILVERFRFKDNIQSIDQITPRDALFVGFFQCLALCPGVSRAASTIIGGMTQGLKRTVAAEYSFLAAVPIMVIVSVKDFVDIKDSLSSSDLALFAVGFGVAFIAALFAVKGFVTLLQKMSMTPFGIYRIAVAVIFFVLLKDVTIPH